MKKNNLINLGTAQIKISTKEHTNYNQLATNIWKAVQYQIQETAPNKKDAETRIAHSLEVQKLVYDLAILELDNSCKLILDLQIGGLIHDMYKYVKDDHGPLASNIASTLGLDSIIINAIKCHSEKDKAKKKPNKYTIYDKLLMDADVLSKLSLENLIEISKSEKLIEKLKKKFCLTTSGQKIFDAKLKQLELLQQCLELEKPVNLQ